MVRPEFFGRPCNSILGPQKPTESLKSGCGLPGLEGHVNHLAALFPPPVPGRGTVQRDKEGRGDSLHVTRRRWGWIPGAPGDSIDGRNPA